jgi:hypothetical protein
MMRKVRELENHVFDETNHDGELKISVEYLPEAEKAMINAAMAKTETPYEQLTEQEKTLVDKAFHRLTFRLIQLFVDTTTADYTKLETLKFHARVMWLLTESYESNEYAKKEEAIMNDNSLTEEQQDKALEALPNIHFYSQERWEQFVAEAMKSFPTKDIPDVEEEVELQGEPEPIKPSPMSLVECLGLDKIPRVTTE